LNAHTTITNPFSQLGGVDDSRKNIKFSSRSGTIGPDKAPKVLSPLEKKLFEQSEQLRFFRKWKREIKEGMKTGEYGPEVIELFRLIKKLPSTKVLIDWVRSSPWLEKASIEIRHNVLSYIDAAFIRWNIRNGYPPMNDSLDLGFDDGQPWEPDSAFIIIRNIILRWHGDPITSKNTSKWK
jgi:hypothetical protein